MSAAGLPDPHPLAACFCSLGVAPLKPGFPENRGGPGERQLSKPCIPGEGRCCPVCHIININNISFFFHSLTVSGHLITLLPCLCLQKSISISCQASANIQGVGSQLLLKLGQNLHLFNCIPLLFSGDPSQAEQ